MDITNTLLELLKYTVPSFITMLTSYLIVQKFLVTQTKKKQLALLREGQDTTIRLRLQAYERLVVFIERMQPRQIIPRIYEHTMTVRDLEQAILFNIRTEFEHNLSQQIYVSRQVWETVKSVKEQEVNMVIQIAKQLNPDALGKELHARIADYVLSVEGELPTEVAIHIINEEAKKVLSFGASE